MYTKYTLNTTQTKQSNKVQQTKLYTLVQSPLMTFSHETSWASTTLPRPSRAASLGRFTD